MGINFVEQVYWPAFELFSRPVTITPLVSMPGQPAYVRRGIFDTNSIDVVGQDGQIFTDTRTELDIIISEYPALPRQGDRVDIPDDADIPGGSFEVIDVTPAGNAGGESTLTLGRLVTPKP
jgi:hypothetical protein